MELTQWCWPLILTVFCSHTLVDRHILWLVSNRRNAGAARPTKSCLGNELPPRQSTANAFIRGKSPQENPGTITTSAVRPGCGERQPITYDEDKIGQGAAMPAQRASITRVTVTRENSQSLRKLAGAWLQATRRTQPARTETTSDGQVTVYRARRRHASMVEDIKFFER
jgi:hypothetical protein